jgi:hypothetical protein
MIRQELRQLEQVLTPVGCPVLLLKGAAYLAAGLPMAEGRLVNDIDIMVPASALGRVQDALLAEGWEFGDCDAYDRRYYLEWMHELPPLQHRKRKTALDVHHAILPRTARLKPDTDLLWAAAETLADSPFQVLCPADMMLHSAAHLFQDGDLNLQIRDVFDLHQMAQAFGEKAGFWPAVTERAHSLGLGRPLFYGLRYSTRLFGTEVPETLLGANSKMAPHALPLAAMDLLVPPTLMPPQHRRGIGRRAASLALYMRSHWLRMPPLLLAAHLARKAIRRRSGRASM